MTPSRATPRPSARRANALSWALLLLSIGGFAAAWVVLSLHTGRQHSWMAVVGALDIAWMLRLGGWQGGFYRMTLGLVATGLIVVMANWGITASHLGNAFGLQPWDSALKLGVNHAWTLAQLANGIGDVLWLALAFLVAAWASR
ncbi:MAG: hypothetical protein M3374_04130 [Pseudomonadota bacterium]|nr:hypothetical protein [Pseudomonadota bacterium]